jgi:hypothetical protein
MPRLAVVSGSTPTVMYRVAAIDRKAGSTTCPCPGRSAGIRVPGWTCGRPAVSCWLVSVNLQGVFSLMKEGYLRIPVTVRRWCGLQTTDRVLVTADLDDGLMVVHPPAACTVMISLVHAAVWDGVCI